jgi:hypothetical protein
MDVSCLLVYDKYMEGLLLFVRQTAAMNAASAALPAAASL